MPPQDDDLEVVQHPVLGPLKFPKDMPPEERNEAIDRALAARSKPPEEGDSFLRQAGGALYRQAKGFAKGSVAPYTEAYQGYKTAREGGSGVGMSALYGGARGLEALAGHPLERTAEMLRTPEEYRERREAGYGPIYSAAAPTIAPQVGVNLPEMERQAKLGHVKGVLGEAAVPAGEALLGYAIAPGGEKRTAPAGETLREIPQPSRLTTPTPSERLHTLAGDIEQAFTAPPTAGSQLDAAARRKFGRPYDVLSSEEKIVVARDLGGPPEGGERRVLRGQPPGVLERRAENMPLPTRAPEAAGMPFTIRTDPGMGIRFAKAEGLPEVSIPPRLTDPAEIQRYVQDKLNLQKEKLPTLGRPPIASPGPPAAQGAPSGTLPRIGPPAAPPPTKLGGGEVPRATLDDILRQATGQGEPPKANVPLNEQLRRGQPNVSEKPPPVDPLKAEFPDPAIRRFARANGAELVRAAGARPEVMQAVHDLTNVEVRQAAINAGIDVGQRHVGSRMLLGEGQVGRQNLIDQMIQKGVKPEDIPNLARPKAQTIPRANLKEGDTFVDETGEPRRIVEITKDGKIKTADGTARTYQGAIESHSELNSPRAQLARGGKFIPHLPEDLERHLEPDEIEFLKGRPVLQKNVAKNYKELGPTMGEAVNVARAGHGLGGWWQRFMDTFEALGASSEAQQIKQLGPPHAEALKAMHGAVSGNKAVQQANVIAWGVYRDWLEAGRPTDLRSINNIVKANRGVSGRGGLDTQKVFKLVNSPQFQKGVPFTGEAFMRSPVEGISPGAKKIPSMVATTAGEGNLKRIVFDTHMKDLYGINELTDAQYLAASIHIRQVGEALGYAGGEAQEQMWGTVLGLKQLLGKGLSPRQAAQAYSKDVLASIGKDYAQVIQESLADPEVQEIMRDLKKYGFDPGGPVASERLRQIVMQGARRMSERARPISRGLLEKTARRIASSRAGP